MSVRGAGKVSRQSQSMPVESVRHYPSGDNRCVCPYSHYFFPSSPPSPFGMACSRRTRRVPESSMEITLSSTTPGTTTSQAICLRWLCPPCFSILSNNSWPRWLRDSVLLSSHPCFRTRWSIVCWNRLNSTCRSVSLTCLLHSYRPRSSLYSSLLSSSAR